MAIQDDCMTFQEKITQEPDGFDPATARTTFIKKSILSDGVIGAVGGAAAGAMSLGLPVKAAGAALLASPVGWTLGIASIAALSLVVAKQGLDKPIGGRGIGWLLPAKHTIALVLGVTAIGLVGAPLGAVAGTMALGAAIGGGLGATVGVVEGIRKADTAVEQARDQHYELTERRQMRRLRSQAIAVHGSEAIASTNVPVENPNPRSLPTVQTNTSVSRNL